MPVGSKYKYLLEDKGMRRWYENLEAKSVITATVTSTLPASTPNAGLVALLATLFAVVSLVVILVSRRAMKGRAAPSSAHKVT